MSAAPSSSHSNPLFSPEPVSRSDRRLVKWAARDGAAWGGLLLGLALTAVAAGFAYRAQTADEAAEFEKRAASTVQLITVRLAQVEEVLYGLRGLFVAHERVNADAFRAYVASSDLNRRHPALIFTNYAAREPAQMTRTTPAPPSGERYTLRYVEPREQLSRFVGADLAAEPSRRAAIERSRDQGTLTASSPVELFHDAGTGRRATVLFAPLYRQGMAQATLQERRRAFYGVVALGFRFDDLVGGALTPDTRQAVRLRIRDLGLAGYRAEPQVVVFDDTPQSSPQPPLRSYLEVGGRTWQIEAYHHGAGSAFRDGLMAVVVAAGLGSSLLLFLLIRSHGRLGRITARVTERVIADLRRSEERFRSAADGSPDAILILQHQAGYGEGEEVLLVTEANRVAQTLLGLSRDRLVGRAVSEIPTPNPLRDLSRLYRRISRGNGVLDAELDFQGPDGARRLRRQLIPMSDGVAVTLRDVTERRRAQQALRDSEARIRSIVEHAADGIIVIDSRGRVESFNPAAERLFGYSAAEIVGRSVSLLMPLPHALNHERYLQDYLRSGYSKILGVTREVQGRRKDGSVFPMDLGVSLMRLDDGIRFTGIVRDVSERKAMEERMRHLAHHDALTGLPNRLLLMDRLQQALARARRQGQRLAVAFVDLDGFKAVNDRHGHDAGDRLLQQVARRLYGVLREVDTVARPGGDEFIVLLEEVADRRQATQVVDKLLRSLTLPFDLGEAQVVVGASIGLSLYPEDGTDADALLKAADAAMYAVKKSEVEASYRTASEAALSVHST